MYSLFLSSAGSKPPLLTLPLAPFWNERFCDEPLFILFDAESIWLKFFPLWKLNEKFRNELRRVCVEMTKPIWSKLAVVLL